MRVTLINTYAKMSYNLSRSQTKIATLTEAVSSGKTLQNPEDDPSGWVQAMDLKQSLRRIETYQENLEFAEGWTNAASNAITQLEDLFVEAKEISLEESGADQSEEHDAHLTRLEEIIEDALSLANTEYRGRYLFGGSETSTEPFSISTGGGPSGEDVVVYNGNQDDVEVRVGDGRSFTVNQNGQDGFSLSTSSDISDPTQADDNILSKLVALRDAVDSQDQDAITDLMTDLDDALNQIRNMGSEIGNQQVRIEQRMTALENLELQTEDEYATVAEDDIIEVITKLQQSQVALEASLQVSALVDDLSLMNFI